MSSASRSSAPSLARSPFSEAALSFSGPPPAYAETERPRRERTSAGVSVSVRPVAADEYEAIELTDRARPSRSAAPSRSKRPNSPPAADAAVPWPAAGGSSAPLAPPASPAPTEERGDWDWASSRRLPGYTFEQQTAERRCRNPKAILIGTLAAGGVAAVLGYYVFRHITQGKDDSSPNATPTGGASATTSTRAAASASPSFAGLAPATYAFNGLGTDDTCSEANLGLRCLPTNHITTFRFAGTTGGYSVFNATDNQALTVLPQSELRKLDVAGPNTTITTASGCSMVQSLSWHLSLSPQSFAVTSLALFANADTRPCGGVVPERAGEIFCHCVWGGSTTTV